MTLEELHALLHIAVSGVPVSEDLRQALVREQLVKADTPSLTERAQVFIDHILALPLPEPVAAWRMPGASTQPIAVAATPELAAQETPPAPPRPLNFRPGNPIPTDPEKRKTEAKRLLDSGWGMNEVAQQLEMPTDEVEAIFFGSGAAEA